jgi:hypothetical protein
MPGIRQKSAATRNNSLIYEKKWIARDWDEVLGTFLGLHCCLLLPYLLLAEQPLSTGRGFSRYRVLAAILFAQYDGDLRLSIPVRRCQCRHPATFWGPPAREHGGQYSAGDEHDNWIDLFRPEFEAPEFHSCGQAVDQRTAPLAVQTCTTERKAADEPPPVRLLVGTPHIRWTPFARRMAGFFLAAGGTIHMFLRLGRQLSGHFFEDAVRRIDVVVDRARDRRLDTLL